MNAYIIRRLLLIIPTLFVASLIVFFMLRFVPGDALDQMISDHVSTTDADIESLRHALGLDVPVHVQYWRWVAGIILHGDFGNSLWKGTPVTRDILQRIPVTFELGVLALVVALLISFPIGIYSGIRQDTIGDYIARSFAILCIAVPSFWLGTMIMVFPSIWWGWSPSVMLIPFTEDPIGNLKMFIVPAVVLGMLLSGVNMRMLRTMMLEVLRQDYVRTAWSKGLTERSVIFRHALKNALIPVVTIVGLRMHTLIGGSVVLETIFCIPGIGRLLVTIINNRDYNILSGVNLVMASFVLLINLAVDLTYAYLDPRVHYR